MHVYSARVLTGLVVAGGLVFAGSPAFAGYGHTPVTVCHKPNSPAQKTLTFDESALAAHLAHGDTLGECAPVEPEQPVEDVPEEDAAEDEQPEEDPVEEEEAPEVPEVARVTSFTPAYVATCDTLTFSHPAFKSAFGESANLVYQLTVDGVKGEKVTLGHGETITTVLGDEFVAHDYFFTIWAQYPGVGFDHQLGQIRGVSEPCEVPVVPEEPVEESETPAEPEEPAEEPADEEPAPVVPEVETPEVTVPVAAPLPNTAPVLAETGAQSVAPWVAGGVLALVTGGFLALRRARITGMTE